MKGTFANLYDRINRISLPVTEPNSLNTDGLNICHRSDKPVTTLSPTLTVHILLIQASQRLVTTIGFSEGLNPSRERE